MSIHQPHDQRNDSVSNMTFAFWLNLFFACIEIFGGIMTNSVAIMSDALHDFGDSTSIAISVFLQKKSLQKRDVKYSYGYKRFSLLGAFINGFVLIIGSVFVVRESIARIFHPAQTSAKGMILLAIFGLIVNGMAAWKIHRGHSLNEKILSWHLFEDVFGWLAVFLGAICMYFTGWTQLDPILSLGFSIFILVNVYKNIQSCIGVFLQNVPENVDIDKLIQKVRAFDEVKELHDVHIWSLDGELHILTLHIVLHKKNDDINLQLLKSRVRTLAKNFGIGHVTIEIEEENEKCGLQYC